MSRVSWMKCTLSSKNIVSLYTVNKVLFVLRCTLLQTQLMHVHIWYQQSLPLQLLEREGWALGSSSSYVTCRGFRKLKSGPAHTYTHTRPPPTMYFGWHTHKHIVHCRRTYEHSSKLGTRSRSAKKRSCAAADGECPPSSSEPDMKRKSERRRAESRKKRYAAQRGSEAETHSDVYIGTAGKMVCAAGVGKELLHSDLIWRHRLSFDSKCCVLYLT